MANPGSLAEMTIKIQVSGWQCEIRDFQSLQQHISAINLLARHDFLLGLQINRS